uniref:Uncharacterized protein n=1 Tax=Angiostrongylus cantonensis TaxID=6313 RepID=A0A0K0DRF3_ANGCA
MKDELSSMFCHAQFEVNIVVKWYQEQSMLIVLVRCGLVVKVYGSHPYGPGSIPGNGILFCLDEGRTALNILSCLI